MILISDLGGNSEHHLIFATKGLERLKGQSDEGTNGKDFPAATLGAYRKRHGKAITNSENEIKRQRRAIFKASVSSTNPKGAAHRNKKWVKLEEKATGATKRLKRRRDKWQRLSGCDVRSKPETSWEGDFSNEATKGQMARTFRCATSGAFRKRPGKAFDFMKKFAITIFIVNL